MTSQGSVATQLERALRSRSDVTVRALAAERRGQSTEPLPLGPALRVLLAMATAPEPGLYWRASERWLRRYRGEATGRGVLTPPTEGEVALVREALRVLPEAGSSAMGTAAAEAAAAALATLLEARHVPDAVDLLDLWLDGRVKAPR